MKKDLVVWGGCLLLFMCGGIFFKLMPVVSFKFELSWDAFSAVGTVSAVVVSLYLASSTERKRQAENKERSSLVAARLWPIAEALKRDLDELMGWAYFDNLDSPERITDIREKVKRLRVYLDRMTMQDIERIVAIDLTIASFLSRAIGEIEGVVASVERESKEWDAISQASKDFYRKHWGDAILTARDYLLLTLSSLMHAAQKATPLPEWE